MTNYYREDFLKSHIRSILDFYAPRVVDTSGGFFQNYRDNGDIFNPEQRHLVSSCRMVFNFCKAYELLGDEVYLQKARHGLQYVTDRHWNPARRGYNWTLGYGHAADDETNHCYGLAFVLLCFSAAHEAGLDGAREHMQATYDLLEQRFWDSSNGIYADDASPDWSSVSDYRGQNANMHTCEAMLAAYEAGGEKHYLERAYQLAKTVTISLAEKSDGLVWEHFTPALEIDWDYNKDNPKHLYRPWGFQPGHQTEWAKLLLTLHNHKAENWMVEKAVYLFDTAVTRCWDDTHGGLFYGFAPDGTICDDDKYFWVQAESLAAAARLHQVTGEQSYKDWYQRLWEYAWQHMIDHEHGAWYRILKANNEKYSDEKSTAGGKCDYHTIGACWDVLRSGIAEE